MANRGTNKKYLISTLLDHVGATATHSYQYLPLCDSAVAPIHLTHDSLGKPLLRAGDVRGPCISFSKGGGKIWAALCADASDIGIDAASSNEFKGEYPVHRVFHDHELRHALKLTDGDVARASALLWSIRKRRSRLLVARSTLWSRGTCMSLHQEARALGMRLRCACRQRPWRDFLQPQADPYRFVRFHRSKCGFPLRSCTGKFDEVMGRKYRIKVLRRQNVDS